MSNYSSASAYSTKLTQLPIYKKGSPSLPVTSSHEITNQERDQSFGKGATSSKFVSSFSTPESDRGKEKYGHVKQMANHIEKGHSGNSLMNGDCSWHKATATATLAMPISNDKSNTNNDCYDSPLKKEGHGKNVEYELDQLDDLVKTLTEI